jgi:hypothetical protein
MVEDSPSSPDSSHNLNKTTEDKIWI